MIYKISGTHISFYNETLAHLESEEGLRESILYDEFYNNNIESFYCTSSPIPDSLPFTNSILRRGKRVIDFYRMPGRLKKTYIISSKFLDILKASSTTDFSSFYGITLRNKDLGDVTYSGIFLYESLSKFVDFNTSSFIVKDLESNKGEKMKGLIDDINYAEMYLLFIRNKKLIFCEDLNLTLPELPSFFHFTLSGYEGLYCTSNFKNKCENEKVKGIDFTEIKSMSDLFKNYL